VNAICLLVAGVVRATLPTQEFTLAWDHSVQKTRWEERYRQRDAVLQLVEARVQGTGAGMEPPPSAILNEGWWSWRPGNELPELRLALSSYTADYTVCWGDRCRELRALVGPTDAGATVVVRPCVPAMAGNP
jgi:hypothetical protein